MQKRNKLTPREKGLARGREAGAQARGLPATMRATFKRWKVLYATAADMDFASAIRDLDRRRLNDQPSLTQFPELRGHADLLRAERQGFVEASGLDEAAAAFHRSASFFEHKRLNTRHVARWDLLTPSDVGCTGVYFPDGVDGVTVGQNYDIPVPKDISTLNADRAKEALRQKTPKLFQGGGSAAVLLDDEPKCIFPADPFVYDLMPPECRSSIDDIIEFLTRYNEFWGPGNCILVDLKWNGVVAEKTNCMVAFRRPVVGGACAATACAYLDPKLGAFQLERARKVMRAKGEDEGNSPDVNFHIGAGKRYRRLVELVAAEARAGATLWGALGIISDHAVPYPERICLAGEAGFPDLEPLSNWTVLQHAAVVSGRHKRCLYRSVQSSSHAKPIYKYRPKLMLGPGVKMRPEWRRDIAAGRCELALPAADG